MANMVGGKPNRTLENDENLLHRQPVGLHRASTSEDRLLHLFDRGAPVEITNYDVADSNKFRAICH